MVIIDLILTISILYFALPTLGLTGYLLAIMISEIFNFFIKFKNLTLDNNSDGFGGYTPAVITERFWILVDFMNVLYSFSHSLFINSFDNPWFSSSETLNSFFKCPFLKSQSIIITFSPFWEKDAAKLAEYATIPSREGLLTMLAGGMIGIARDLSICLDLYSQQKEEN